MAKMFYTLEEAKAALGRSEDEIKQFAREGRLREFRDGPRLMFKADQVEQLRAELGSGGPGGTGTGMRLKDDTAVAGDIGLSGSLGGVPSPTRSGSMGGGSIGGGS